MRTFYRQRSREESLPLLEAAGWKPKEIQHGGDFEDFIRTNGQPGALFVDFYCGSGEFLLDRGDGVIMTENTKGGDAVPEYNAILDCLYAEERTSEEPCDE